MRLAESMGEDAICPALETLVAVCRRAGDFAAAKEAVDRYLGIARRVSDFRLYFALRDAADVALDLGDTRAARAYLDEAAPLAVAFDRQCEVTANSDDLERRRKRLVELEAGEPSDTPD